jgi:hypothetical protein
LKVKAEGNSKQSKIFLGFSSSKPKIASKANQRWKTKEPNREKQRKYFWSFCVLEAMKTRTRTVKKAKHEYTKDRLNMIYR